MGSSSSNGILLEGGVLNSLVACNFKIYGLYLTTITHLENIRKYYITIINTTKGLVFIFLHGVHMWIEIWIKYVWEEEKGYGWELLVLLVG